MWEHLQGGSFGLISVSPQIISLNNFIAQKSWQKAAGNKLSLRAGWLTEISFIAVNVALSSVSVLSGGAGKDDGQERSWECGKL